MNARIADFCNAIQGETTAAGRSGVFLEIAVIPRRVDEFVGASSGHRQAPSGSLAAVTRLRVGNLAQEDMAPAPETTDSRDAIGSGVVSESSSVFYQCMEARRQTNSKGNDNQIRCTTMQWARVVASRFEPPSSRNGEELTTPFVRPTVEEGEKPPRNAKHH